LLQKSQQVCIDLVRVGCWHSVRETWINLERGTLHQLSGLQRSRGNRHDLVIVTMKNERGYVELLQIFGEVGFRASLNDVVARVHPAYHALEPPLPPNAVRDIRARTVVAVERKREVLVKLRPIFHILSSQVVEHFDRRALRVLVSLYHERRYCADEN